MLLLVIVVVVQLLMVAYTFPVSELSSERLLFHIDSVLHWYDISAAASLSPGSPLSGYDPYFSAGMPAGLANTASAKFPAFIAAHSPTWMTPAVIWKWYAFLAPLVAALCLPAAARLLGLGIGAVMTAALLGLLLWWTGMFRWFYTAGMVSFVLASFVSIPYSAWLFQLLEGKGGSGSVVGAGLVGGLMFFVHPLFPLPVAFAILAYLALNLRGLQRHRLMIVLSVVPILSLIPNLGWLYYVFVAPLEHSSTYIIHQRIVDLSLALKALLGIWEQAGGTKINPVIAIAAVAGLLMPTEPGQRRYLVPLVLVGMFFALYAHTAGALDILARLTQPNRFMPVAYLFLSLPAAVGFSSLTSLAFRSSDSDVWKRRLPAGVVLLFLGVGVAVSLVELGREVSYAPVGHYGKVPPLVEGPGEMSERILAFLEHRTSKDARVLFETSFARVHDGAHAAGYYALTADREFIGGPYILSRFSGFWDGFLFDQRVDAIPATEMARYFDLYNIGWIIVHSSASKAYFARLDGVELMESWDGLSMFRVNRPHNFFIKGHGRVVDRGFNRLSLESLEGHEVVLKYHYLEGLQSDVPVTIEPVYQLDDPNPFIRLVDPPTRLTLSMR